MTDSVGRSSLENDQPLLLKTIATITLFGSAGDDRRRTKSIRSVKSLDESTQELQRMGFYISRSWTYFGLRPRKFNSTENRYLQFLLSSHGHRLITTKTTQIAIQSKNQVFFLSQDNKARVPICIPFCIKLQQIMKHLF